MDLANKLKGKLNDLLMKSPKLANGLKTAGGMATGFMQNLLISEAMNYGLEQLSQYVDSDTITKAMILLSMLNSKSKKNQNQGITSNNKNSGNNDKSKKDKDLGNKDKEKPKDKDKTKDKTKDDPNKPKPKDQEADKSKGKTGDDSKDSSTSDSKKDGESSKESDDADRQKQIENSRDFAREQLDEHVKFLKDGGIKKPIDENGYGGGKYKPDVISAAVDITTVGGKQPKITFGYNGAREGQFNPSVMELHPDIVKIVQETKNKARNDPNNPYKDDDSFEIWHVENCAEIQAVNLLLWSGTKMENILIRTVNGRGNYKGPCKNCEKTFFDFINDFHE